MNDLKMIGITHGRRAMRVRHPLALRFARGRRLELRR